MAGEFDVEAMISRFRTRAAAVRRRGLPPVEGDERRRIKEQMELDYMDFAILGDARGSLEGGILTLRVDLRPPGQRDDAARDEAVAGDGRNGDGAGGGA